MEKKINRFSLFNYLKKHNIITQVHYIPIHYLKYYKRKYKFNNNDFPEAKNYYEQALSLPLYPGLSSIQLKKIIKVLKNYFK